MTANAPHWTTAEYSTCGAEPILRITMVKEFVSNHVILVVKFGESIYELIATFEPFLISSKLIDVIVIAFVGWN